MNNNYMKESRNIILVTGAAGFIGAALVKKLLEINETVIGIDNLNDYYDPNLKLDRLKDIEHTNRNILGWKFYNSDIEDYESLEKICKENMPNIIINLAAQAGVRYSIKEPSKFVKTNLLGFGNILEICRNLEVDNFLYASSSSVYGSNKLVPFKESHPVDHPVSLYAATKKSNEVMAHCYSSLFKIPSTGLRFFTVYGPWGRPDMAPMIFAKSILENKPIKVFNNGNMRRDFTYIDDIVDGIIGCCYKPAKIDEDFNSLNPDPSASFAPHKIFNIGNNNVIELEYFINLIEKVFNLKAKREYYPMQLGDVRETYADINNLNKWINYTPKVSVEDGIKYFADWYLNYYKIDN